MNLFFGAVVVMLVLIAAGVVVGIAGFRRSEPAFRWLTYYLVLVFITESAGMYTALQSINNWIIYTVSTPFFFTALAAYFTTINDRLRAWPWCFVFPAAIFSLGLVFIGTLPSICADNTWYVTVGSIVFTAAGLHTLGRLMVAGTGRRSPHFWVCIGIVAFYSATVSIRIVEEYLHASKPLPENRFVLGIATLAIGLIMYSAMVAALLGALTEEKRERSILSGEKIQA